MGEHFYLLPTLHTPPGCKRCFLDLKKKTTTVCKTKRAVGNVLMDNGSHFYSTVVGVRFRIYVNRRHGSPRAWGKLCVYIASRHPSAAGRPMVPCQTLWLIVRWIEGSNLIKKYKSGE